MTLTHEIVSYRLLPGTDREAFLAAQSRLSAWARLQPGFRGLETLEGPDGTILDHARWESPQAAQAAAEAFQSSPECAPLGALLDMRSLQMHHMTQIPSGSGAPMNLRDLFLSELAQEAVSTQKLLALLPTGRLDFRPHPKSQTLQELASHLVNIPSWVSTTLEHSELDFASKPEWSTPTMGSAQEALATFETNTATARAALEKATESTFQEPWTLRAGDKVYFTQSKAEVLRSFIFSHLVHHRAQLGVYLRLLDLPLPSVYGPTADVPEM